MNPDLPHGSTILLALLNALWLKKSQQSARLKKPAGVLFEWHPDTVPGLLFISPLPGHLRGVMKSRLCRVKDWSQRAKEAKYSAETLASNSGCSLTELERFFKTVMKMPPHQWMTQLRQFWAKAELQEGIPIKEVAFDVGYKSVPHFSREFKKVHHAIPATVAYGTPPPEPVKDELKKGPNA